MVCGRSLSLCSSKRVALHKSCPLLLLLLESVFTKILQTYTADQHCHVCALLLVTADQNTRNSNVNAFYFNWIKQTNVEIKVTGIETMII